MMTFASDPLDPTLQAATGPSKTKTEDALDRLNIEMQELRTELARSNHHHFRHQHRQPSILPHLLLALAVGLSGWATMMSLNDEAKRQKEGHQ